MQRNTIRKLLNIPEYKVVKVDNDEDAIHVWLKPYKRNRAVCSGCSKVHNQGHHSIKEVVVRDQSLGRMITYLHVPKRMCRCIEDDRIHVEEIDCKRLGKCIWRRSFIMC